MANRPATQCGTRAGDTVGRTSLPCERGKQPAPPVVAAAVPACRSVRPSALQGGGQETEPQPTVQLVSALFDSTLIQPTFENSRRKSAPVMQPNFRRRIRRFLPRPGEADGSSVSIALRTTPLAVRPQCFDKPRLPARATRWRGTGPSTHGVKLLDTPRNLKPRRQRSWEDRDATLAPLPRR